jgi:S1-C subfamily serine protease
VTTHNFLRICSLLRNIAGVAVLILIAGWLSVPLRAQSADIDQKSEAIRGLSSDFESLAKRVSPAVVEVIVTGYGSGEDDENSSAAIGRERSLGTGVIVGSDGYIVTNYHVVKGADRVRVILTPSASADQEPQPFALLKSRPNSSRKGAGFQQGNRHSRAQD